MPRTVPAYSKYLWLNYPITLQGAFYTGPLAAHQLPVDPCDSGTLEKR